MATSTCRQAFSLFSFTLLLLLALEATDARIHSQAYQRNLKSVESSNIKVDFRLKKNAEFGQGFVVAGNTSELGNWDTSKALILKNLYEDHWGGVAYIPGGSSVEFKIARVVYDKPSEVLEWYSDENVPLLFPSSRTTIVLLQVCSSSSSKEFQKKVGDPSIASVQFQIKKKAEYGERLGISGGHSSLGDWIPEQALLMDAVTDDFWVSTKSVDMEITKTIRYKALLVDYKTNALLEWMPGEDREIYIPADIEDAALAIVPVIWNTCSSSTLFQDTVASKLQNLLGI